MPLELIRGMRLVEDTPVNFSPTTWATISTAPSCHLNEGTVADASPYIGVSALFLSYSARDGRVISLDDRINGCFERSMNGKALPNDSDDMKAMIAYFNWMKGGAKKGTTRLPAAARRIRLVTEPRSRERKADLRRTVRRVSREQWRGAQGCRRPRRLSSALGRSLVQHRRGHVPTLHRCRLRKTQYARRLPREVPARRGGLSDQEALDVADYFILMPCRNFAGKSKDWSKGHKPKDARY